MVPLCLIHATDSSTFSVLINYLGLCLALFLSLWFSSRRLQSDSESEPMLKRPGQAHKLTWTYWGWFCRYSWIQKAEEEAQKWVAFISVQSRRRKYYFTSIQIHFTAYRDNNQIYLHVNRLTLALQWHRKPQSCTESTADVAVITDSKNPHCITCFKKLYMEYII